MRRRNLSLLVALVVVMFMFFSAPQVTEAKKVTLDGQGHSLDFTKTVPNTLNYQGFLVDAADSSAVTATLEMTIRIFDSETKGSEMWSETHPAVEVTNGIFHVLLGSVTAFPPSLFDGLTLWLQTEVGTEILAPRKPLVSVAYSQRAETATQASTANWATDAQHAVHADTAAYCPGISAWTVDGDDVYRETGKVGIGTASPTQTLHVAGHELIQGPDGFDSSGDQATLYLGDTHKYLRATYGGNTTLISNDHLRFHCGVDTSQFYLNVIGNVGIGTDAPTQKLDVDGAVNATTYYGDGSNLTGISGSTDNDWTISGDNVYHETGNVGIGTSSPIVALDVDGEVRIGTGVQLLEINQDGQLWDMDDPVTINDCLAVLSTSPSYFTGHLGVGTTNPSVNLQIKGNQTTVGIVDTAGGSTNIYMAASGHDTWQLRTGEVGFSIKDSGTGIDYLTVKTNGNVGIGTTSPSEKLQIEGAGPRLALNTTTAAATALYFKESGSTKWSLAYAPGNDYLYFYDFTKAGTRMVLQDGTGYVGIGTASPTTPLEVNGAAKADTVRVDNDLIVTGAYRGTIGPDNGAPFPRPAYDSGWQSIDAGVPLGIVHNVGGDIDDYVIDMQVNGGTSNRYLTSDVIYWDALTNSGMAVIRAPGDLTISTVRIRIWVYN